MDIDDLKELKRLVDGSISLIESNAVTFPCPLLTDYDAILGGKYAIKLLKVRPEFLMGQFGEVFRKI